jgi:hypothetical protein
MKELIRNFLKSEVGRKWIINKSNYMNSLKTKIKIKPIPYNLYNEMISITDIHNKKILVLFNLEIIELLINTYKINSENISFITDSKLKIMICKKVYGVVNTYEIKNFSELKNKIYKHQITNKYSYRLCITNPPHNTINRDIYPLYYKIMETLVKTFKEVIIIHPSMPLIDNKCAVFSYTTKYKKLIGRFIEFLYINNIPKIYQTPFAILKLNRNYKDKILVNHFNQYCYKTHNIENISLFGIDWLFINESFCKKIKKTSKKLWFHKQKIKNMKKIPEGKFYFQCPYMNTTDNIDDWVCLINKNHKHEDYICKKECLVSPRTIKYYFNTENEIHNFIEYLKTDFVRFCIYIYKLDKRFDSGSLRDVPWLDFSTPWNDYQLYSCFDIDLRTIQYIESVIPDSYGLRGKE